MTATELKLCGIRELFGKRFFIPSYQRGYRWKKSEVTKLLDDILEFVRLQSKPTAEGGFYCLQPVVVCYHKDKQYYEVIDGQQRLTTLYMILKYFMPKMEFLGYQLPELYTLCYETREGSETFLANLSVATPQDAARSIDFHFMYEAYKHIEGWEKEQKGIQKDLMPLLNALVLDAAPEGEAIPNVRVIWYELDEDTDRGEVLKVFERLNIGKIPLTQSELIKALFLQKKNFDSSLFHLKQLQIATEWDRIEQMLHQDELWMFLTNEDSQEKSKTRIDLLFELLHEEGSISFAYYYDKLNQAQDSQRTKLLDKLWLEIKHTFLRLEEWYRDRHLFHYIGYLVAVSPGGDYRSLLRELLELSRSKSKTSFLSALKERISKGLAGVDLDEVSYRDPAVRRILLLFSIETLLMEDKSEMRFPFHLLKAQRWDVEHICSQADEELPSKRIKGEKRRQWATDCLREVLSIEQPDKPSADPSAEPSDKQSAEPSDKQSAEPSDKQSAEQSDKLSAQLQRLIDSSDKEVAKADDAFDTLYERVAKELHEGEHMQEEDKQGLGNLALLDAGTNRSYKNAFFAVKRRVLLERDRRGVFVPIATKNVFLKYYSKHSMALLHWSEEDAADYLNAIKECLSSYFSSTISQTNEE